MVKVDELACPIVKTHFTKPVTSVGCWFLSGLSAHWRFLTVLRLIFKLSAT
jgi:hypothetical protein